jgi:hypothetical protein
MLKLFVLNNNLIKITPKNLWRKIENPLGYSEIFNFQHGNLNLIDYSTDMCWAWPCNYYGIISWVESSCFLSFGPSHCRPILHVQRVVAFIDNFTLLTKSRSDKTQSGVEWSGVEVSSIYWLCKLHSYQWFGWLKHHFAFSYWQFALKMCVFCIGFFLGGQANCNTKWQDTHFFNCPSFKSPRRGLWLLGS